jgi:hypothetical protein
LPEYPNANRFAGRQDRPLVQQGHARQKAIIKRLCAIGQVNFRHGGGQLVIEGFNVEFH